MALAREPAPLDALEDTVGVPLRLIHAVRHSLDNIATIAQRDRVPLPVAAERYFGRVAANERVVEHRASRCSPSMPTT